MLLAQVSATRKHELLFVCLAFLQGLFPSRPNTPSKLELFIWLQGASRLIGFKERRHQSPTSPIRLLFVNTECVILVATFVSWMRNLLGFYKHKINEWILTNKLLTWRLGNGPTHAQTFWETYMRTSLAHKALIDPLIPFSQQQADQFESEQSNMNEP